MFNTFGTAVFVDIIFGDFLSSLSHFEHCHLYVVLNSSKKNVCSCKLEAVQEC